jgi:cyanophycin synthetase
MIELNSDNIESLTLTPRMIAEEVIKKSWKIEQFYEGSGMFRITRSDGKVINIFNSTPPTTSYMAHLIAQDKFACYALLENSGYPLPKSVIVGSVEEGLVYYKSTRGTVRQVVKPLDKAHGAGITTNISSPIAMHTALERAFKLSKKVIIQEHVESAVDTRILVIDGRVSAALQRIPAIVIGDGKSTIEDLVKIENESGRRGEAYSKPLSKIKLAAVKSYLGIRVKEVPLENERVQVVGVANVGVGGETRDITDELPDWLIDMAIGISEYVGLKVCGVDILLSEAPTKQSKQEDMSPYLIEVNKCPALFIHELPHEGQSRLVTADYIEYLGKI